MIWTDNSANLHALEVEEARAALLVAVIFPQISTNTPGAVNVWVALRAEKQGQYALLWQLYFHEHTWGS
jgi:hypothetical protein